MVHTFLSAIRIHDGTGPAQRCLVAVGQLEAACGLVCPAIAAAFLLRRPVGAHAGLEDAFHAIIHTDLSAAAVKNQQPGLGAVVIHRILDHAQANDIPVGIVEGNLFLWVKPVLGISHDSAPIVAGSGGIEFRVDGMQLAVKTTEYGLLALQNLVHLVHGFLRGDHLACGRPSLVLVRTEQDPELAVLSSFKPVGQR